MKKIFLSIIMVFACFATSMAQQAKIGFFSYEEALKAMPDYTVAMASIDKLRQQYAQELKTAENEFNEKYELFLDQQATLAAPIRQKRQADLQNLFDRNTEFRKEAERLLKQAEKDAFAPLKAKLDQAVKAVGRENGMFVILNTDSEACPYIDEAFSQNVTDLIINKVSLP